MMTLEQLDEVTEAYAMWVPPSWRAIAVTQRMTTHEEDTRSQSYCGLCAKEFEVFEDAKEIVWKTEPGRIGVHKVSTLVCRNGVACRRRASAKAD